MLPQTSREVVGGTDVGKVPLATVTQDVNHVLFLDQATRRKSVQGLFHQRGQRFRLFRVAVAGRAFSSQHSTKKTGRIGSAGRQGFVCFSDDRKNGMDGRRGIRKKTIVEWSPGRKTVGCRTRFFDDF